MVVLLRFTLREPHSVPLPVSTRSISRPSPSFSPFRPRIVGSRSMWVVGWYGSRSPASPAVAPILKTGQRGGSGQAVELRRT
jgi:hypothetical protein